MKCCWVVNVQALLLYQILFFKRKKNVQSSIYIIIYSIAQSVKVSLNFTVFYCTVLYWYIFHWHCFPNRMFIVTAPAQQSNKCSSATLSLFYDTAVRVSSQEGRIYRLSEWGTTIDIDLECKTLHAVWLGLGYVWGLCEGWMGAIPVY